MFRFAGIFLKSVSVLEQERQKSTDRWKGLFFLQIFYILFLVSFFFYLQQIGTGTYSTRCIQTCYPGQVSQFTLRVLLGKNQCFESGFRIRIRVFYDTKCEIYQKLKNNKRVDWKNIFFFHFLFSSSNFSNPLLFTRRIFWDWFSSCIKNVYGSKCRSQFSKQPGSWTGSVLRFLQSYEECFNENLLRAWTEWWRWCGFEWAGLGDTRDGLASVCVALPINYKSAPVQKRKISAPISGLKQF